MAVYTEVSTDAAAALVARLSLGRLERLAPVTGGIENTNYFVDTERGRYVLTLFERMSADQLPFYLRLMQHLAQRGLPVPEPHADADGQILLQVCGKPAALVDRLPGEHALAPDRGQCAQLGAVLARMHLAAQDFPLQQPNPRGLAWWEETVPLLLPHLNDAQRTLITAELAHARQVSTSAAHRALPRGPVHADLFRDNVLLEQAGTREEHIGGVIDFYFAGCTAWLYDLAVTINDWCIHAQTGLFDEPRAAALLDAYHAARPLTELEHQHWRTALRAAALRFWISRLYDLHLPRRAELLTPKDPVHFERVLIARRTARTLPWPA